MTTTTMMWTFDVFHFPRTTRRVLTLSTNHGGVHILMRPVAVLSPVETNPITNTIVRLVAQPRVRSLKQRPTALDLAGG